MKYILTEHKKFFLAESASLMETLLLETESKISITLAGLFTNISKIKDSLNTDFNLSVIDGTPLAKDKEKIEKELKTTREEVYDLLFGKRKFKEILGPIRDRAQDHALITLYHYTNVEVGNITDLCNTLSSAIDRLIIQISQLKNNKIKSYVAYPKEFTNWFEQFKQNLLKIKNTLEALYKAVGVKDEEKEEEKEEEEKEEEEKVEDATATRVNLAVAFEELLKLSVKYEKAFNNTAWNYSAITKDADRIAAIGQFADKVKASGTASIPTSKLLWEAYFSWVWEDKLTDSGVRNVLVQQLFALGFSEKTNIFIPFLRNIVIEKNLTITQGAYTALHNLRAKNILKASHLQVDATPSLAYCPAILKTDSGNTVYRLVEQSIKLLAAAGKALQYKSDGDKTTKVSLTKENQQGLLSFFYTDTQNTDGIDNMADAVARALETRPELTDKANTNCYLNPECKLRDESRIKVLIADMEKSLGKNFDDEDSNESDKKAITGDEGAAAMWKRITASTLGTEKDAIAMFLSYLVLKHAPSEAVAEKCYTLINKGLYKKDSTKPTGIGMSEVLNKLELYNKLIKDIKINSGNIEKTLEILLNTKNIPEGLK